MKREALSEKVMVLGVDGLDPRFTRKLIDAGKMPSFKKLTEQGAQRHDLVLLGSNPTVTPPQWTTLAVGCNPNVHGITQFFLHNSDDFTVTDYNIDSRNCKAEPVWNCTAEAGKKTLVLHWPGSSWPPTSDSENLYVVDGTSPGSVGMSTMQIDSEIIFGATEDTDMTSFMPRAVTDAAEPCIVRGLNLDENENNERIIGAGKLVENGGSTSIVLDANDGYSIPLGGINLSYDASKSKVKSASGWAQSPEDAKECTIVSYGGLVRRPALILKNAQGIYDHVEVYRSKKETKPLAVLYKYKMVYGIVDDGFKNEDKTTAARNMMLLDIAEDGSNVKIFLSAAYDLTYDGVFHPKYLHKALLENAGPFPPSCQFWRPDYDLFESMWQCWTGVANWMSRTMHYMIEKEGIEVIFSHYHAVDLEGHTIVRYLADHGRSRYTPDVYEEWMTRIYQQTDDYIGSFLHYLDEGWTIIVTSDHGLVSPEHEPGTLGDMCGTLIIPEMEELGYTVMIKDKNGNNTREVDWSKTRAVAQQGNDIFINLKGRNGGRGIVDPKDKYELEEQIMTDLYSLRDEKTGKRKIALALRNKDAALLGYGGPTAGDIFYATAEGYQFDHCDALSTSWGVHETSVSPIFIAAGAGLKKGYETDRVIRQVDVAPTIAVLLGCRFPAQCEGAPVYQIFEEEI